MALIRVNAVIGFESCNFFSACHSRRIVELPDHYRFIENCFDSLFAVLFSYEIDFLYFVPVFLYLFVPPIPK